MSTAVMTNPEPDLDTAYPVSGQLSTPLLERAAQPINVVVDEARLSTVASSRMFLLRSVNEGRPVYGSTTGFGPLVRYAGRKTATDQCDNVLDHLTVGQGPDLPPAVVRAAVLTRLWSLAQGVSGVSPAVIRSLTAMLATSFAPAVPQWGSVGASGDLVPLSYVGRSLQGYGHAYLDGVRMDAAEALDKAGLAPLDLDGRDALGLVNGTSLTAATAGLAVAAVRRSHTVALVLAAAMSDLLGCGQDYLADDLLRAFGHPEAVEVGRRMRHLLAGGAPTGDRPLQEPYSIRCVPQLLGAAEASIRHVEYVVGNDLNGVSDNPLFFPDTGRVVHGGNFFGQPVAFAADLLSLVAVQLGNLAERSLDLLLDPHRNGGLPPMLAAEPGKQHGLQGAQVTATAIVANMRRSATPASVQSLPFSLHNQDVVPFGTQAALTALEQAQSLRWLHGVLAIALRQMRHVGARRPSAPACADFLDRMVDLVAAVEPDRPLDTDVPRAADALDRWADQLAPRTPGGGSDGR